LFLFRVTCRAGFKFWRYRENLFKGLEFALRPCGRARTDPKKQHVPFFSSFFLWQKYT
jgi:hypothetical protein